MSCPQQCPFFMHFFLTTFLIVSAVVGVPEVYSKSITVTDGLNRNVTIDLPIERIVTVNTSSAIILRALGVNLKEKAVGVTTYITDNSAFWPELKDKPAFEFKSISYEKLVQVNPQVILLYNTSPKFTDEEKLAALGIKWLYLDCFDPDTLAEDVRLLGRLFEKEDVAEKLITWFTGYDRLIRNRLADLPAMEKPDVFYFQYPDVNLTKGRYNTVNRDSSSHPLIDGAGGNNLAAGFPFHNVNVSAEWIVENNPDVIIAGVLGKGFSGYSADPAKARKNMENIRKVIAADYAFKDTTAVKDNRLLILSHDIKQGPSYVIGMAYMARFLYPECFSDISPETIAREYYETWCGLPYQGVYAFPQNQDVSQNPIKVTDSSGRRLSIPQPLERIAGLQTSSCSAFSLLGLEERVVGVTEYILNDPDSYPHLKEKPNVGSVYTPNYEIIAQVMPQVVFMGTAPVNLDPAVEKLSDMGVTVAAFDFQPITGKDVWEREENFNRELLQLGEMTGTKDRAREFIRWKTEIFSMIEERTRDAKKKEVLGMNSLSKILNGNGFTVWAGRRIIELAGGIDLGKDIQKEQVSEEWLIETDPEVIIVSGFWLEEGLGYGVSDTGQVKEVYGKLLQKESIADTRAAKNGNLFVFSYYGLASGGQTALGALYLAKRLYPDRFSDVDPTVYHKKYLEKWFHTPYRGVWFYP